MSQYVTAEAIAEMCDHARHLGDGYICSCPLHPDRHESLKVSPGQKATVLWCHAGCATDDILVALNLSPEMLFYDYDPDSGGGGLFSLQAEMRELKRQVNPPPPLPNTLLGLMDEAFALEQPWHDRGLEAASETWAASDGPADALRRRKMTLDSAVFAYFGPWCVHEGKGPEHQMKLAEWGMERLQKHWRSRLEAHR